MKFQRPRSTAITRSILPIALLASCAAPISPSSPDDDSASVQTAIIDPNAPLCQDPIDMVNPVLDTGNGVQTIPGCCGGSRLNQSTGKLDVYSNPADETFVRNLRPKMPLFAPHASPFTNDQVHAIVGWVRGPRVACGPGGGSLCTNGHGAIDYVKTGAEDQSFQVRAVAAGKVIAVEYEPSGLEGNTVTIEHTALDGTRYRSIYVHLRNGAKNDCNKAKMFATGGYATYMATQNCAGSLSAAVWGTNTSTIKVALNQTVSAGQYIADAGNTGAGAIGRVIDASGHLSGTGNIHLHLYFAVRQPGAGQAGTNAEWITVDPYGVYGYFSTPDCYAEGANTPAHRLFAPFNALTARNDFDGDYRTDFVLYRPSEGNWFVRPQAGGPDRVMQFGVSTDLPVPGDYDGDGQTDFAVFRPSTGEWFVRPAMGSADVVMQFGVSTDKPVPGDYDGDGKTDFAVFRPSTGEWFVRPTMGGADIVMQFGVSTDKPVPADYDGDGKVDWAVYRPSNGTWFVRPARGGADIVTAFGGSTDKPVPGDYDGDGKADRAFYRPSTGAWNVHPSTGGSNIVTTFGVSTDRPVAGDYDGDGKTDVAVFRPSDGTWRVHPSAGGANVVMQFGVSSDQTPFL